jgi:hypothetical protein
VSRIGPSATRLADDEVARLRRQAGTANLSFVDPAQLLRVERFLVGRRAWAAAILGKPFSLRAMTNREVVLLDLASQAEPEPPEPDQPPAPRESGYQPSARYRAELARQETAQRQWRQLAEALPVAVSVAYNYSGPHHYEFHVSGANHIIMREHLGAGRLQRDAGKALCETPSRSRHLLFCHRDAPEDRVPTCKACLRIAYRITGLSPGLSPAAGDHTQQPTPTTGTRRPTP